LYKTRSLELLQRRGQADEHPDPVATTWLMAFDKVSQNPLAMQILQQCAFLPADGIVQKVFAAHDALEYDQAIDEILKHSLLKRDDKVGMIFMHRLVQEVLRAQLTAEQQKAVVEQVVKMLVDACPLDETDFPTWKKRSSEWLANAREGQRWSQELSLQTEAMGTLFNRMGYYLAKIGDYRQALPLFQEALAIREQVLGKRHPDYATSLNNLALLYHSQGAYEQALPLFQEALAILAKVLGEQHPNTQTVWMNYLRCLATSEGITVEELVERLQRNSQQEAK
jgi:tetratricopeptide (TPR) repeat protein